MSAPQHSDNVTHDQLARCIEALREPVADLLADIPPLIVASVLVEILIETARFNPAAAPEILSQAVENLAAAAN